MRFEKVRFIAGAVVGATINFTIQSVQMAIDYDRNFDWNEFFVCAGAGAFAGLGPRLCRRPAAETWNAETLPNLQPPEARNSFHPPDILEPATNSNHSFFHSLVSAGLIAWAISGKHTLKLSRTTRLFLWAFGIGYLSHITLDRTTPKPVNLFILPSHLFARLQFSSAFLCALCISAVKSGSPRFIPTPRIPINFNVTGNLR